MLEVPHVRVRFDRWGARENAELTCDGKQLSIVALDFNERPIVLIANHSGVVGRVFQTWRQLALGRAIPIHPDCIEPEHGNFGLRLKFTPSWPADFTFTIDELQPKDADAILRFFAKPWHDRNMGGI